MIIFFRLQIVVKFNLTTGRQRAPGILAKRLPNNGVIIADEVGMGKTRIAVAVARAVIAAGGRVAILVPPGLGYQWSDELQTAGVTAPPILRSLWQYLRHGKPRMKNSWFMESALALCLMLSQTGGLERTPSWGGAGLCSQKYMPDEKKASERALATRLLQ